MDNEQEHGFTPGPWEAHKGVDADAPDVWDVTSKRDWNGGHGATPQGWFVATVHEVRSPYDAEPNAHLIAAAPDMFEALEYLVSLGGGDCLDPARAALAKARGQDTPQPSQVQP